MLKLTKAQLFLPLWRKGLFVYEFMGIAVNLFCSLSLSSAFVYSGHLICISSFFNQTWLICFIKFSSFSVSSIFSFAFIVYWFFSVIFTFHFVLFSSCLCLFFINIISVCFCADLSISWLIFVFLCGYIAGPSSNNILGLVPRGLFVHMYNCYWLYFEYCRVNYTDMLFFFSLLRQEREALYTRDGSDDVDHGPQQETVHIRRCSFQRGRNGASACAWRTKRQ